MSERLQRRGAVRAQAPDAWPTPGDLPRVLHRDEDFVVVDKPAGWLTHADGRGERPDVVGWIGEPVGVHHRLDIDTTGALWLSRSPGGRRRLAEAFEGGGARKRYLAVVDGRPPQREGLVDATVPAARGRRAVTAYCELDTDRAGGWSLVEARPETGRTHQIRAHFAGIGAPIRGDQRYGSPLEPRGPRCLLHCASVEFDGAPAVEARPPPDFARYLRQSADSVRAGLVADPDTTCYRLRNGSADGCPGWWVDRYGDWLWIQNDEDAPPGERPAARGVYSYTAPRDRSRGLGGAAPVLVAGEPAPAPLEVREHGVVFRVELAERLSTGLFFDMRPHRAWLARHAAGRVLNTFAHAGAFSVAAAVAGAETTSIDLSPTWLDRITPQLAANGIDPAPHRVLRGDVFDWLRRLAKRGERFDHVILDPPSTSVARGRGRKGRRWSAARDYGQLVEQAVAVAAPGATIWTCTNHRGLAAPRFASAIAAVLPVGARLWRVGAPAVDFPTDEVPATKVLLWRIP